MSSPTQPHDYIASAVLFGTPVPIGTADIGTDGVVVITFHRWPETTPGAWDGQIVLHLEPMRSKT